MPKCQWREKPGSDPVCTTMASAGQSFCPRHAFLEQVRQDQQLEQERVQRLKRQVVTAKPLNRRDMIEKGYQLVGNDMCACGHAIEWWRTPNQREAPYEPMKELTSPCNSHFVYCKRAFEKRWKRRVA